MPSNFGTPGIWMIFSLIYINLKLKFFYPLFGDGLWLPDFCSSNYWNNGDQLSASMSSLLCSEYCWSRQKNGENHADNVDQTIFTKNYDTITSIIASTYQQEVLI